MIGRSVSSFDLKRSLVLVFALLSLSLPRSGGDREASSIDDDPDATFADGALEWRLKTLRGRDGRIPPDGWVRAHEHIRRMRGRRQHLEATSQKLMEQKRDEVLAFIRS